MHKEELDSKNITIISGNFKALADSASRNPEDRETVFDYFDTYERISGHDHNEQVKYYQLKYLYEKDKWRYLNILAKLFLNNKKPSLAFMCLVESLRLNCKQREVYGLAQKNKNNARPNFPVGLVENKCVASVITCTQGSRFEELKESIQSVLNQTFQNFELIIVNDGGTEKVKEIVDSFCSPKIKYCRFNENRGISAALNEGVRRAEGKYIAYLDDDDIYYPDHLEILVNTLEKGDCPLAYTNSNRVEGIRKNGTYKKIRTVRIRDQEFDRNRLLILTYILTCSVMHKKEIFSEIGLFNEDMVITSDWDFWLRSALKYDFQHVSKCTSEYRAQSNGITGVNQLGADFFGKLIPKYYKYFQGRVAFIKYFLEINDRKSAYPLYEEIRNQYGRHFRVTDIMIELIDMAFRFDDKAFLALLSKNYFQMDARGCLKEIKKRVSIHMFLGIAPQLPLRIAKSIIGRFINLNKSILKKLVGAKN